MNTNAKRLINHLMRGGNYGYYWTKEWTGIDANTFKKTTYWFPADDVSESKSQGEPGVDIYFGVFASREQVPGSQHGNHTKAEDVMAANCLYADFDGDDFDGGKIEAWEHIQSLKHKPNVVVDSGGGYHCYWLFAEPLLLNDENRTKFSAVLKQWNKYVGGDKSVHDLARVLRVPGTTNYKQKYDKPRPVTCKIANYDRLIPSTQVHAWLDEIEEPVETFPAGQPNDLTPKQIVSTIMKSEQRSKFAALFNGDDSMHNDDTSAADFAFCQILAFWTGGDAQKIDKIFRGSKRMRDKWNRDIYRIPTIRNALKRQAESGEYYLAEAHIELAGALKFSADDYGNAQSVLKAYPNDFLYVGAYGMMQWTGTHWDASEGAIVDKVLNAAVVKVFKARRHMAFTRMDALDSSKQKAEFKSAEAVYNATKATNRLISGCIKQLEKLLTVSAEEFISEPDLLNCRNGVVNLQTGGVVKHHYSQRFRYCIETPYKPQGEVKCTKWRKWLSGLIRDQEIFEYVQKALGYSITGHTRQECLFWIWGDTRCGKGIFTETIIELLGRGTSKEVDIELFMADRSEKKLLYHELMHTRFVTASEPKKKSKLVTSTIKTFTGGNWVRGRTLHKSSQDYRPQSHLWITANELPKMDCSDRAAWGRIEVIHFHGTWLDKEDTYKKDEMKQPEVLCELLSWAIEGAMKWYKDGSKGLIAPDTVKKATEVARDRSDDVKQWLTERGYQVTGGYDDIMLYGPLMADYKEWCGGKGLTMPEWVVAMHRHGFLKVRMKATFEGKSHQMCVRGIVQDVPMDTEYEYTIVIDDKEFTV